MPYYIFLYCTTHDDGKIITSDKPKVHGNCLNCNCNCKCNCNCDYIYNGIVHSNGDSILEIVKVYKDYDKYGGGFKFEYYKNYCEDELLRNWIINNS